MHAPLSVINLRNESTIKAQSLCKRLGGCNVSPGTVMALVLEKAKQAVSRPGRYGC